MKKFAISAALAAGFASSMAYAAHPDATYVAELNALNTSGGSGTAVVAIKGDTLTVVISATGLTPGQSHAQHIHGSDSDPSFDAFCPNISFDTDGDNLVTIPEGAPAYGAVLLSLSTDGTSTGEAPVADENGNLAYSQTFTLGSDGNIATPELLPLENRVIVLHGQNVMGTYNATLPAVCGQLVEQ